MATEFKTHETPVDDWIDNGVSFLQADVTIHRNPAIYAEYGPLLDSIRNLEAERVQMIGPRKRRKVQADESLADDDIIDTAKQEAEEASLADENPLLAEINAAIEERYARAQELWAKYSEDTEVWTFRRLDEHEVVEEREALGPVPEEPRAPSKNSKPQAHTAYRKRFETFLKSMGEYAAELNLRCVARAAIKVVVKGEEKTVPDLEGFRRLKARPGGQSHIVEMVTALEGLSGEDVSIMAPHREGA